MADKIITDFNGLISVIGLYQNVYKDIKNGNVVVGPYYLNPRDAFDRIQKVEGFEYQFTALVSNQIFKYEGE